MYNRYVPGSGGYTRVIMEESERTTKHTGEQNRQASQSREYRTHKSGGGPQDLFQNLSAPLRFLGGEDKNAGIAGILKSLHLEDLDSGDILLLLIILLVFLEGDNIELVITLGLMLLLGLGEEKHDDQKE